jgi:hypothetical protein
MIPHTILQGYTEITEIVIKEVPEDIGFGHIIKKGCSKFNDGMFWERRGNKTNNMFKVPSI